MAKDSIQHSNYVQLSDVKPTAQAPSSLDYLPTWDLDIAVLNSLKLKVRDKYQPNVEKLIKKKEMVVNGHGIMILLFSPWNNNSEDSSLQIDVDFCLQLVHSILKYLKCSAINKCS